MRRVSIEEMIAVMEHYKNGGEVEFSVYSESEEMLWKTAENPIWDWYNFSYRIKDNTPSDGVPWKIIDPKWKWAAKDDDGSVWLYENKPTSHYNGEWTCVEGEYTEVSNALVTNLGADPKNSRRKRPD